MDEPADSTRNRITGAVTGTSVQAGVIEGGLHLHPSEPVPVPRQLPPPPTRFTGRTAELAVLAEATSSVVVLSGPGGVGKTALSLQWARSVADRYPDGQLFVDLNGFSPRASIDPSEVLGAFLRALGTPPEKVPVHLPEQTALYRSLTADKALLVLLDNTLSAAQARVLVPSSSRSLVVVTSRSRLVGLVGDGAQLVEVAPLPAASAYAMFAGAVGAARVAGEQGHTARLVALCDGLPIAIRVAASRLLARRHWSVRRVHDELVDERSRLVNLSQSGDLSVRATFDLSYKLLDPRAAAVYRRLSLHPGDDFGPGLAAAVLDDEDADALLERLVDVSLVEEHAEDRYRFLDLLRLHAGQRLEADDTAEERAAALRRIIEWYLYTAMRADEVLTPYRRRLPYAFSSPPRSVPSFADRDSALGWLERERPNLVAVGRAALDHDLAELSWHMSDVMWPLFLLLKLYRDRLDADERGVAAARRWGNEFALADMLKRLGLVLTSLGDFDQAERHLTESVELWARMNDQRGLCDAREGLALLYQASGRTEEATAEFGRLAEANLALGATRSAGLSLINLGRSLVDLGRAAEARPVLVHAEQLFGELGQDPYNHARATIALAAAHCGTGDLGTAAQRAEDGLRAMTAAGSDKGRADALHVLGTVAQRENRLADARDHLGAAEKIYRSLGSPLADIVRTQLT
ncbi:Predicted ATPase [Lentzea albidocapillata subsp. violacea]|uniref:Predicted ATPase n=1 Tax=Lentzea albidocapillata subsp. violacea TaxID=128104 RepID=A0A1G9P1D8_9PSEU|nr:tetratricopeptide repeat protein [Lentzea albidocapillata]SDL91995.1 Predicted ATPase [Lentzea albidocapillata subsp. violacea]